MKILGLDGGRNTAKIELDLEDIEFITEELRGDGSHHDWYDLCRQLTEARRKHYDECPSCGMEDNEVPISYKTCQDNWHKEVTVP